MRPKKMRAVFWIAGLALLAGETAGTIPGRNWQVHAEETTGETKKEEETEQKTEEAAKEEETEGIVGEAAEEKAEENVEEAAEKEAEEKAEEAAEEAVEEKAEEAAEEAVEKTEETAKEEEEEKAEEKSEKEEALQEQQPEEPLEIRTEEETNLLSASNPAETEGCAAPDFTETEPVSEDTGQGGDIEESVPGETAAAEQTEVPGNSEEVTTIIEEVVETLPMEQEEPVPQTEEQLDLAFPEDSLTGAKDLEEKEQAEKKQEEKNEEEKKREEKKPEEIKQKEIKREEIKREDNNGEGEKQEKKTTAKQETEKNPIEKGLNDPIGETEANHSPGEMEGDMGQNTDLSETNRNAEAREMDLGDKAPEEDPAREHTAQMTPPKPSLAIRLEEKPLEYGNGETEENPAEDPETNQEIRAQTDGKQTNRDSQTSQQQEGTLDAGGEEPGIGIQSFRIETTDIDPQSLFVSARRSDLPDVEVPVTLWEAERGTGFEGTLESIPDDPSGDGIYQITARAVDGDGNPVIAQQELRINRYGSHYSAQGDRTIRERNLDEVTDTVVMLSRDGDVPQILSAAQLETSSVLAEDGWYEYTYQLPEALFLEEGEYEVQMHSRDGAGNKSSLTAAGESVHFVVDHTAPELLLTGIEPDEVRKESSAWVCLEVRDRSPIRQIRVFRNGKLEQTLPGEQLKDGLLKWQLKETEGWQTLQFAVTDQAGNTSVTDVLRAYMT